MAVKTLLLLTFAAHTCTAAIFNDSAEHGPSHSNRLEGNMTVNSPKGPSGRSFSINVVYETQTYEPIPIGPPDENLNDSFTDKNSRQGRRFPTVDGRRPCNTSDPNVVKCNWTKQIVKKYEVSQDTALFLKGPVVTRVMPSFYIILFVISFPLNTLALLTFTCKIKEKKPAVIYMSNLACVDLLFTLLLPLKIHYHLNGSHWVFGEVMCRVLTSAFYCYMYCSILLMMCIGVDRLVAVVFPISSLTWRKKKYSVCVCALVWVLALAGTVPMLSVQQSFKIENVGTTCHDALLHNDPDQTYVYQFSVLTCIYYFLPLVVILVCYSIIIYVLSGKSGRLATASSTTLNKRRRAVIMIIAMITEFVVCFAATNGILLFHCVLLATTQHKKDLSIWNDPSYMAYMLALFAGSSSVFLDPLLYYYGSSQCRQKINSLFWWKKTKSTLLNSYSLTTSSQVSCKYSQARIQM